MKNRLITVIGIVSLLGPTLPAHAWFATQGHDEITRAAVALLPPAAAGCAGEAATDACFSSLFRLEAEALAAASVAPDLFKPDEAAPQLDAQESAEHYIDLELFQGRSLPSHRYEYLAALREIGVEPERIGVLPYAVVEWTQRLTVTFAALRRDPRHSGLRAQALTYAGILSHYAGDMVQPLHTSIHHNGWAEPPRYESPRTGIHFAIDGLIRNLPPTLPPDPPPVEPFADLWTAVLAQLAESHSHVAAIYSFETAPGSGEIDLESEAVRAFAQERFEVATRFVARLWVTAWEDSAEMTLPGWYRGGP